jgi:putative addiction module component (TIGR02574 family)
MVTNVPGRSYNRAMATLDIARLTPKERLDLIGELWDSLAPEDVSLTPAQDAELAHRMATFEADRHDAEPWAKIDAELDRRRR